MCHKSFSTLQRWRFRCVGRTEFHSGAKNARAFSTSNTMADTQSDRNTDTVGKVKPKDSCMSNSFYTFVIRLPLGLNAATRSGQGPRVDVAGCFCSHFLSSPPYVCVGAFFLPGTFQSRWQAVCNGSLLVYSNLCCRSVHENFGKCGIDIDQWVNIPTYFTTAETTRGNFCC